MDKPEIKLPTGYRWATVQDRKAAKPRDAKVWVAATGTFMSTMNDGKWDANLEYIVPTSNSDAPSEPPFGYRLATRKDFAGPKPEDALFWDEAWGKDSGEWERVVPQWGWNRDKTYAVRITVPDGYRLADDEYRRNHSKPANALYWCGDAWRPVVCDGSRTDSVWLSCDVYAVPIVACKTQSVLDASLISRREWLQRRFKDVAAEMAARANNAVFDAATEKFAQELLELAREIAQNRD
jgi:hypothetical protein